MAELNSRVGSQNKTSLVHDLYVADTSLFAQRDLRHLIRPIERAGAEVPLNNTTKGEPGFDVGIALLEEVTWRRDGNSLQGGLPSRGQP